MSSCCWPECETAARSDLPLCEQHFAMVGNRIDVLRRIETSDRRAEIHRTEMARRAARRTEEIERGKAATEQRERAAARSVVYYVRTGRYIKIGYTSDLRSRLHSLRLDPASVLATEPGGRRLEAERHQQFAADRIGRREDFAESLALQEHIRELNESRRE